MEFKVSVNGDAVSVVTTLVGFSGERPSQEPSEALLSEYNGLKWPCKSETVTAYYAKYEFTDSAAVEIELPDNVESVKIKPESASEKVSFSNGRLTVQTDEALYFVVQPNGDIFRTLSVFLDKAQLLPPPKRNVIEFTDGEYTADNCEYIRIDGHGNPVIDCIGDDTVIYIGKDATVKAAIELRGVKNVEIAGTGSISTVHRCIGGDEGFVKGRYFGLFRYYAKPNILIRSGCENIKISGVTLDSEFRGIVIRNSRGIVVERVKIFASPENADGINCYNTSDLTVDGCFINSKDDCFCMYNGCDSIPTLFDDGYEVREAVCRNVEFKNCIISTVCRPFVFGGHATGSTSPRCLIENLYIHDVEIIETPVHLFGYDERFSFYWTAVMRVLSQSEQTVRNITFENINVHISDGYNGKLFHLHVRASSEASYTESRGHAIENIVFNNISFNGCADKLYPSVIICRESEGDGDTPHIDGVTFRKVTVNGKTFDENYVRCEGECRSIVYTSV